MSYIAIIHMKFLLVSYSVGLIWHNKYRQILLGLDKIASFLRVTQLSLKNLNQETDYVWNMPQSHPHRTRQGGRKKGKLQKEKMITRQCKG